MIGTTISHYKILQKIGEGGMGIVYKAHDTTLDRTVALKFLPHYLTSDPTEKERFYHEARAAAALTHQNIAVVYEIGEYENPATSGKQIFIAMEYVEGKTLKDIVGEIHESPLQLKKVLDIAIQVCDGLAAAHEKGIVHRDIKSENLMVTSKGQVKITDFGLAKLKGATKLTKAGSTLGTAAYMSPEQARGEEVDQRSDIFSFGVVLYEMLTIHLPFRGEHIAAIQYSILNEEPPPLARYNEKATDELQHIVSKALEKEQDDRYQHIDEMLADLRRERKKLEYAKSVYVTTAKTSAVTVPSKHQWMKIGIISATLLVLVVLVLILNPFNFEIIPKRSPTTEKKSIAVLPFKNMNETKEDEYFSDGLTEDLIAQLSKISDIRVISRTSVMQYKGVNKSIREIAAELNVVNILEGSVRSAGNNVRIVAQLIDAAKDEHIWAETYDREMTQIFTIQSDIAFRIATALKSTLTQNERDRIQKAPTDNITSYSYYMRGREYYNLYSNEYNEKAISLFQKSLELDPQYALAYAGLGDAFAQRVQRFGYSTIWIDSSIAYSTKAITIDPTLADGYKALGLGYSTKGRYQRAIEMYNKAIEYNPGATPAAVNIGFVKLYTGKFDEAFEWLQKGLQNDPMNVTAHVGLGYVYFLFGDFTKYEEIEGKLAIIDPGNANLYIGRSLKYLRLKEYQRAMDEILKPLSVMPKNVNFVSIAGDIQLAMGNLAEAKKYYESAVKTDSLVRSTVTGKLPLLGLGYIMWKEGNLDEARKVFSKIVKSNQKEFGEGNESFSLPLDIAYINANEGKKEEAYKWLQKAVNGGWRLYNWAQMDPMLENLRDDEKFKSIITYMQSDVDRMRERMITRR